MVFCRAHIHTSCTYNVVLGVLLGECRLDVNLELVFALEQN